MLSPHAWCTPLQRTFSSFPGDWVGATLLVLRVVVGGIAIAEAVLAASGAQSGLNWAMACAAAISGLALLLGFLAPIAGALLAGQGAILLAYFSVAGLRLLDSRMALFEFVVMSAALAILGPGATSIDAHLFGRKEVAIRDRHRPSDL
jgi:hypothetical protein